MGKATLSNGHRRSGKGNAMQRDRAREAKMHELEPWPTARVKIVALDRSELIQLSIDNLNNTFDRRQDIVSIHHLISSGTDSRAP